jgi:trigger factor
MDLKIETRETADRQLEMTVEVPQENLEAALHGAARRLGSRTKIPGFRPGKAPYEIILKKLGDETVFDEALDSLGQEVYRKALEDSQIEPYAPGTLEEVISRSPLVLRYTVPLAPNVELGDYRSLRLDYQAPTVDDQAVADLMEELRQSQALIEPADRPAQLSDVVIVDVLGELQDQADHDTEKADGKLLDEKAVSVLLAESTDWPIPGIAEHLLGITAGEERSFDYAFPEDYGNESLRSLQAHFSLKCLEVKSRFVPEWSDDLARNIGDFDDLLSLRVKVRQDLEEQARRQAEADYAKEVIDKAVEQAEVSHPPLLLQEEVDGMLKDFERRLRSQHLTLQDYLKIEGRTEQEMRQEFEPQARERLKRALVLGRVVELENLEVQDDEISVELDRLSAPMADQAAELRKVLDTPGGRRRIALDLLTDKAVQLLAQIARGEAPQAKEAKDTPAPAEVVAGGGASQPNSETKNADPAVPAESESSPSEEQK